MSLEKSEVILYSVGMDTHANASGAGLFIARLEHMMQVRDYSAADLSRLSGISPSALSNILSGKRALPRAETVRKLAAALEVSDGYLLGSTDDPTPPTNGIFPEYGAEMLEQMRRLGAAQNYTLLSMARALVHETGTIRRLQVLEVIQRLADARGIGADLDRVADLLMALETVPPNDSRGNIRSAE